MFAILGQVKIPFIQKGISLLLLLVIISTFYILGAIQPSSIDDWHLKTRQGFYFPTIPESGRLLRRAVGDSMLCLNGFSMFKPAILLTAILISILIWNSLSSEKILVRFGLTLLAGLGFPYLGNIITWNVAASQYTVAVIWMFLWYVILRAARKKNRMTWWMLLFVVSFFTSTWHEVWLISFSVIAGFLLIESFCFRCKRIKSNKLSPEQIAGIVVAIGYVLAIIYYTRRGPEVFIDRMVAQSDITKSIMNWSYIIKVAVMGTKENMVTIKDCIPIFALIGYIKLNKNFHNRLEKDFKLLLFVTAGVFLSSYAMVFIKVPFYWRVRWMHACILSVTFFAFPNSVLIKLTKYFKLVPLKIIRRVLLALVIIWLSYNAYFTYYYTNIDVVGWLRFRQKVLSHDDLRTLGALEELSYRTIPEGRPKGTAKWDHVWGAQDDRYRFFSGPDFSSVRKRLREHRDKKSASSNTAP